MVRHKACRGELPVSLPEKIEILVLLAVDRDEESRNSAFHTLESWPPEELQQVLSNPSTPVAVLEFVAYNLAPGRKELGTLSSETQVCLASFVSGSRTLRPFSQRLNAANLPKPPSPFSPPTKMEIQAVRRDRRRKQRPCKESAACPLSRRSRPLSPGARRSG